MGVRSFVGRPASFLLMDCEDTKCKRLQQRKKDVREICKFSTDGQHCEGRKCKRAHQRTQVNKEKTCVYQQGKCESHYNRVPSYRGRFDKPSFKKEVHLRHSHHSNNIIFFFRSEGRGETVEGPGGEDADYNGGEGTGIIVRPLKSSTYPTRQSRLE